MAVQRVEEELNLTSSELKLTPGDVVKLARSLNAMNGVKAQDVDQGRAIKITITAKSVASVNKIKVQIGSIVRHAHDHSSDSKIILDQHKTDELVLLYLKSKS